MLTTPGARYLPEAAAVFAVLLPQRRGICARYGRPIRLKINDTLCRRRRRHRRRRDGRPPETEEIIYGSACADRTRRFSASRSCLNRLKISKRSRALRIISLYILHALDTRTGLYINIYYIFTPRPAAGF